VQDGTRFAELQARRLRHIVLLGMLVSMHKWSLLIYYLAAYNDALI